jgi:NADH-quinone oxidoreductase subunit E
MAFLSEELREKIRALLPNYASKQAVTLPALHLVQDSLRCVPLDAIRDIAEILDLHPSEVHDTMSFYGFFRDPNRPLGKHRVWVCRSISCMLRGGEELLEGLCHKYGLHPGDTTSDGKITLEFAECLGACEGAPCMLVNDECHVDLTEESAAALIEKL